MLLLALLVVVKAPLVLVVDFQGVSLVSILVVAVVVEQLRLLRGSVGAFECKRIVCKQMSFMAIRRLGLF